MALLEQKKYINVPLPIATKSALELRARMNGRSQGREAARIIEREMRKQKQETED